MPQDPPVDNNSQANPDTDTSSYTPNNIKWGSKDRSDGRIWIRSELGNNFYPEEVVRSAITKNFKENFGGAWSCWKDAKQNEEVPLLWFNDFKAKFKWLANDEANIKKSFNSRGSLALKNALFKVRSGEDKGEWVGVDNLKQLEVKWKEEKWQKNSLTNKQNRQSKVGHNVHSGGSISARVHSKKMRVELDKEPTWFEIYDKLHRPKGKPDGWFNKGIEGSSKGDLKKLHAKVQHPTISSKSRDIKPDDTHDVTTGGTQMNSRSNVKVLSPEIPMKTEVEEAYEGEDEHEDSPSIKREFSDFDLQVHEAVASKVGYDPAGKEINSPSLYKKQTNIQLEDEDDKYDKNSVDLIQSGHVSDPGMGKPDFWASPELKRSCSNLERRDISRKTVHHFPSSKSHSFEDLQELSANQIVNLESPRSVMTQRSADRVMLKRRSSSQVLPSGSKKLWWKLFLWSHRNIHQPWVSKSTQLHPASAVFNSQCGYSSDILEPKQGKTLRHMGSPCHASSSGEYFSKSGKDKNMDNQRWSRFHKENNFDFRTQNQWVAFSTESSSFNRVDEWVKDLENQQPPSEDDFADDNIGTTVLPPSPDADRSMARTTTRLPQNQDANLSKDLLYANSVVQSLNPASTAAHISGIGMKVIPAITHFCSLRSVNLSNNFIVHITPGFLPKGLHTLNLSRNKISTIEGLRELTRLRVLDLSYNRISRIGQGLSSCTLVKELYLAGNKISDVEGLHRLFKLTVLDLSFNKMTTTKALRQLVANYNSVLALNLLGNPIQSNISDEQLRKAVCDLLPKLVYLNKQSIKPQRAREMLTDSVAKAALGNSSRTPKRRTLKKGGQGGSSSSSVHRSRSSASLAQNSSQRSKSQTRHH